MREQPYTEIAPPADLAAVVDRFWMQTALRDAPGTHRILPDGCVDVIVDLARGTGAFVGAMTAAIEVPAAACHLIAVRFRPGTAAPIVRSALDATTDDHVDLAALGMHDLVAPLVDARSATARLTMLANWVRARAAAPDPQIAYAIRALVADSRVDAVADELGVSRQHLARAFRREVGVSPKQLARIARVQRAVAALRPGVDLARLAVELGYFDQAHFSNEVRAIVGIAPSVLAAAPPRALAHLFAGPATPSARPP